MSPYSENTKFIITNSYFNKFREDFNQFSSSESPHKMFFMKAIGLKEKYKLDEFVILTNSQKIILDASLPKYDVCKNMALDHFCVKNAPKGEYDIEQAISIANEMPEEVFIITNINSEKEKILQGNQKCLTAEEALEKLNEINIKLLENSNSCP